MALLGKIRMLLTSDVFRDLLQLLQSEEVPLRHVRQVVQRNERAEPAQEVPVRNRASVRLSLSKVSLQGCHEGRPEETPQKACDQTDHDQNRLEWK